MMKKRLKKTSSFEIYELASLDMPPTFGRIVEVPQELSEKYFSTYRQFLGIQKELEFIYNNTL